MVVFFGKRKVASQNEGYVMFELAPEAKLPVHRIKPWADEVFRYGVATLVEISSSRSLLGHQCSDV